MYIHKYNMILLNYYMSIYYIYQFKILTTTAIFHVFYYIILSYFLCYIINCTI